MGGGRGAGTLAAEAHLLVGQRAEVGDLRLGFLVAYCCGCQRWLIEIEARIKGELIFKNDIFQCCFL